MERFGYTLKQAKRESTELMRLIEAESWGDLKDREEELAEQKAKMEAMEQQVNRM